MAPWWDGEWYHPAPTIRNNLIVGNSYGIDNTSLAIEVYCNDVWDNDRGDYDGPITRPTDISADPLFCDSDGGDFRLDCNSPCLPSAECDLIGALEMGCGGPSVTVPTTWGAIKSMYR